jgi:hypothetical protein
LASPLSSVSLQRVTHMLRSLVADIVPAMHRWIARQLKREARDTAVPSQAASATPQQQQLVPAGSGPGPSETDGVWCCYRACRALLECAHTALDAVFSRGMHLRNPTVVTRSA